VVCGFSNQVVTGVVSQSLQEICCCMGWPVAGNPAQYVMEKAFAKAGLDWRYLTLEIAPEALADAIRGMRAFGFRGANFTAPHKMAVIEHLDELTPAAQLVGAVTCVSRQGNQLVGENTDGKGLMAALSAVTTPTGKKAVVVGAGHAGRAVAVELGLAGATQVTVVGRSEARAADVVALIEGRLGVTSKLIVLDGPFAVPAETDILVNATPIGVGDASARVPLDLATLQAEQVVADVVFNPPETRLMRDALERGCTTIDGLSTLVHHTQVIFKIWTGLDGDASTIREALEEFLGL
jgi:shikimate dehydrogenase